MTEASWEPATPDQLIKTGLININNANIFASDTRKWNYKDAADKKWTTFKLYFYKSQKSIKKSHPQKNLSNIWFHQKANATSISDKVIASIAAQ